MQYFQLETKPGFWPHYLFSIDAKNESYCATHRVWFRLIFVAINGSNKEDVHTSRCIEYLKAIHAANKCKKTRLPGLGSFAGVCDEI